MLHGIHCIFPPPSVTNHPGEDPIAMKKLLQLEGMFQHTKEILGWKFNGKEYTITLPMTKANKILSKLEEMLKQKYTLFKPLEKMQGKLVHASLGLPGGKGLLAPIYTAVAKKKQSTIFTGNLRQCLKDWKLLILEISSRPTSVLELVPHPLQYVGYVDASKTAAGGVWVNGTCSLPQYIVWRLEWPQDIQNKEVSEANKQGTLSINDLETAGTLLAWLVFENIAPVSLQYVHTRLFCDNNSAVNWVTKRSTTTSTIAGHLLRALSLRLYINKAALLQITHIAGKENRMADMASRSFTDPIFTKANTSFLTSFNILFPLKSTSWKEFQLPKRTTSK